ncbi:hypothetical protein IQ07DRAFT_678572 [Pyrenochaeta sp. DS3sAY3a]|nr:hypothetical protein IQ07DRAFT_678572 [Pyrenochaeta sp. DS3sAY3a]
MTKPGTTPVETERRIIDTQLATLESTSKRAAATPPRLLPEFAFEARSPEGNFVESTLDLQALDHILSHDPGRNELGSVGLQAENESVVSDGDNKSMLGDDRPNAEPLLGIRKPMPSPMPKEIDNTLLQGILAPQSDTTVRSIKSLNQENAPREIRRTRSREHFYDSAFFVLKTWWQEWSLLLVSVGLLVAITSILRHYHQQPQPSWKLGLSLNSLIAVLATLLRSSIVTVVEEVLGQTKWLWQQRRQPVINLARFDEASRGPWGALLLLCSKIPNIFNRKLYTSNDHGPLFTACLVSILSLAIGAFTQQAIKTVPCSQAMVGANASIPVAVYAHPFFRGRTNLDFDMETKARIVDAFRGRSCPRPTFLKDCTTGNCTFEAFNNVTHVTSGFCSRCVELTNLVVAEKNTTFFQPPSVIEKNTTSNPNGNGQSQDPKDTVVITQPGYLLHRVVRLPSSRSTMLALSLDRSWRLGMTVNTDNESLLAVESLPTNFAAVINIAALTRADCSSGMNCSGLWYQNTNLSIQQDAQANAWSKSNVVFTSCGLYPCARHLRGEAQLGKFIETVVREELYLPAKSDQRFIPPCWENNTRYDTRLSNSSSIYSFKDDESPPCIFGVSPTTVRDLGSFVSKFASGNCSAFVDNANDTNKIVCRAGEYEPGKDSTSDQWWIEDLYKSGDATFASIAEVMENLALAITDSVRMQEYPGVRHVPGTIWESTVCTDFNWPWISFPAALVALTMLSLAMITSETAPSRDGKAPPIWKSSILPLVYNRFSHEDGDIEPGPLMTMRSRARKELLVLEKNEEQWGFRLTENGGELELDRR